MRIASILAASTALAVAAPALAFDASRYSSPTFNNPQVDKLTIQGTGSTGEISGMSVRLPDGGLRLLPAAIAAMLGDYSALADFRARSAPFGRNFVTVGGCTTPGDGGAARYRRIAPPPEPKLWQVQIADGSWWQLMGQDIDVRSLCAMGGAWTTPVASLPNDGPKLQAALDYVGLTGGRVQLPGALRFRTDQGLVARVNWQTTAAVADESIHFKDNSSFEIVSAGGGAIVAGVAMEAVLTLRYSGAPLGNIGPFMSRVEGWTIDGNGLARYGLFSDFTMHVSAYKNRLFGATLGQLRFVGYGGARVWANVFRGPRPVSMQGGGGDTWIGPNDYYPAAGSAAVSIGAFGSNTTISGGVFNGEGKPGIVGVDLHADGNGTDNIRHVVVSDNEFSGMNIGVRAAASPSQRNIYGLIVRGNHTTPAAGGGVHTGILAHFTGLDEAIVESNLMNSSRQTEATDSPVFAFNCANLQIRGNRAGNYRGPFAYFHNVRRSQVSLNDVEDVGRGGSGSVIVDLDGGSVDNDFLDNTFRQTSASFAQNGLFERANATRNFGRNRFFGVAAPSTVAGGSSSSFTAR